MATNIGTLMATVGVDTRPLKKGLKEAEQETKSSTSKMLSHWKSMAVGIVATYALYKTAALVKETALLAARFETLDIVMQTVGKNAGYSAVEMEKYDLALRKTGISMTESRNSLARMAQAQLDLSKATELGRIAQDAAVIGNINSSEAFQRMIYGIQSGNLLVLKTIGINVSFEQSYKDVAKATGRATTSFTESEKAIIRQNAVIKYGTRIAGTYEAAMTTAGKKLSSFTRYVEDFKVKMGLAFGPATVTLVDAATKAMKEMQEEISKPEAQEALRELSSLLADLIVKIGESLPKAIEKAEPVLRFFSNVLKTLEDIDQLAGLTSPDDDWWTDLTSDHWHSGKTYKMPEWEGIDQAKRMEESLGAGGVSRLSTALDDPDKYYGGMEKYVAEPVGGEDIKAMEERVLMLQQLAQIEKDVLQEYYAGLEEKAIMESESDEAWEQSAQEKWAYQLQLWEDEKGLLAEKEAKEKEAINSMASAWTGWASDFGNSLNEVMWGADLTFASIAESFAKMITQMMIQAAIIQPLMGSITGSGWFKSIAGIFSPSAKGNIFSQTGLHAFASGGVVNKPTQFAFAGGAGLMGEAGPEAIMPLTRTPGGDLGVKASGGGSQVIIKMENPVFQDVNTQRQVFAQIAETIAARVAPGAIVENYNSDGVVRSMIRGGV